MSLIRFVAWPKPMFNVTSASRLAIRIGSPWPEIRRIPLSESYMKAKALRRLGMKTKMKSSW